MSHGRQAPLSALKRRGWMPWITVSGAILLLLGLLPSAFAQGTDAASALPIDSGGKFNGTVGPNSSQWYKFRYDGGTGNATITVKYEPPDSNELSLVVFTGSVQNLRRETTDPTRTNNTLTYAFSDPDDRDVFLQIVNDHGDRSVSFVGTVTPSTTIVGLPAGTQTATPGPSADDSNAALTVGTDGRFQGTEAPRRAVWWKFYYGNPGADAVINVNIAPNADNTTLDVYTADGDSLDKQSGDPTRTGDQLSRKVSLGTAQWVWFTVVNSKDDTDIAYAGTVNPVGTPPATATPTASPTGTTGPTSTPSPTPTNTTAPSQPTNTPVPTSQPQQAPSVPHDSRYFPETGYRIDNDAINNYFNARGRIESFGFPVSRTFSLQGCQVQIFQRQVAQVCDGSTVQLINLLDPETFPYTKVNGSTFPGPDDQLKNSTPKVSDANYATAILDFVRANAPDSFNSQPVNFGLTFFTTVTPQQAGTSESGILGLFDLEIWGAPISRPQADPANANFIYQRFQRGIMHYTAGQGTRGILLADYLKQIFLGPGRSTSLPGDLAQQAQGSKFFAQYCPGAPGWLCRPNELVGTDLTFAFEQG